VPTMTRATSTSSSVNPAERSLFMRVFIRR
jgi:hypothetical protein